MANSEGGVDSALADGPVWDGTAWVHPVSGHRWDGQRWIEPPPASPTGPGRGLVFFQVAWRALVGAIAGGTLIAFAVIVFFIVRDQLSASTKDTPTTVSDLRYAAFGLVFGLLLGVPAGVVVGGVVAWRGVPYRGARRTRLVARVTGLVLVLAFLLFFFRPPVRSGGISLGDVALYAFIYATSLGGTWVLSSWTVRWYVRRMDAVHLLP